MQAVFKIGNTTLLHFCIKRNCLCDKPFRQTFWLTGRIVSTFFNREIRLNRNEMKEKELIPNCLNIGNNSFCS